MAPLPAQPTDLVAVCWLSFLPASESPSSSVPSGGLEGQESERRRPPNPLRSLYFKTWQNFHKPFVLITDKSVPPCPVPVNATQHLHAPHPLLTHAIRADEAAPHNLNPQKWSRTQACRGNVLPSLLHLAWLFMPCNGLRWRRSG